MTVGPLQARTRTTVYLQRHLPGVADRLTSEGEDDKDRFEENDNMEKDPIPHQEEVVKKADQILKKRKRSCRLVPKYQETQTDEGEDDED